MDTTNQPGRSAAPGSVGPHSTLPPSGEQPPIAHGHATTVVIPTWNSLATLPRALSSIEDATARVEILLIDDRSDDQTALRAIADADPRVRLIVKAERTNAAHSRALGLAQATSDLVLFLDSDDYFRPGHIARRRRLHAVQDAGLIIGRFRLNDGLREWDGPMTAYLGGDIEEYIFIHGGDARSSTMSIDTASWRGTSFDTSLTKHQDWGFALAAGRNAERIGFDPAPGVIISLGGDARMSGRSNIEASLAFARDHMRHEPNRRRFYLGRLRTSVRLGDAPAARRFRDALLGASPSPRERWGSAALLLAARLGIARPVHRLLTARR